jgi:hypothetical protein
MSVADETLTITLYWQAVRRMDESYKFFVHLYDAETDELLAQKDAVPRGWSYPTNWWEAGEIVTDEARLSIGDLSPQDYELAVGVYNPDSGERLPVAENPTRLPVNDRRLFLMGEGSR